MRKVKVNANQSLGRKRFMAKNMLRSRELSFLFAIWECIVIKVFPNYLLETKRTITDCLVHKKYEQHVVCLCCMLFYSKWRIPIGLLQRATF